MSILPLDRRAFLTLPLALLLAPLARAGAEIQPRRGTYQVDVGVLYDMFRFHVSGTLEESVDRTAGTYSVRMVGEGQGIANRVESQGVLRGDRWSPLKSASFFNVQGRESRTDIAFDYGRRLVDYRARGETFFLRRLRVVEDIVALPEGTHVDDGLSAMLNYREQRWAPQGDGTYLTHVVRRQRKDGEGADDVARSYRAELIPLRLRMDRDEASGKPTALFDLSPFSSWARESRPARIVFGQDRRPEVISSSLILGTSFTIRLTGG